jgi:uncharacterized protein (DUF1778 family)
MVKNGTPLFIRIGEEDRKAIEERAKARRRSMSDFVRAVVFGLEEPITDVEPSKGNELDVME